MEDQSTMDVRTETLTRFHPLRRAAAWAICLWMLTAAGAAFASDLQPAVAPSPFDAYTRMKQRLDSLAGFAVETKIVSADGVSGQVLSAMQATVLRNGPMFSIDTRVVGQPQGNMPPRWYTICDGSYFINYAPGRFEAQRTDLTKLSPAALSVFLQSSTPPLLPDLKAGQGTLTQETLNRRLYNVIRVDGLEQECHGIRKYALWIDAETNLPFRLEADFRADLFQKMGTASGASARMLPVFTTLEYAEWKLDVIPPPSRFGFVAPDNVRVVDQDPPAINADCPNCPDTSLQTAQQNVTEALRSSGASAATAIAP